MSLRLSGTRTRCLLTASAASRKFGRTPRRYRTIEIQADPHAITGRQPPTDDPRKLSTASTLVQVRSKLAQLRSHGS